MNLIWFFAGEGHLKISHQDEEVFRRKRFVSQRREIPKHGMGLESVEKFDVTKI